MRIRHLCCTALLALLAHAAHAQTYPVKPLRIIVPFPPGGITDTAARVLAQHLTTNLGQQVVVDNRPGGNSIIGTELVAKAAPDGYTLFYGDLATTAIVTALYPKLPYDLFKDLAPVSMVGVSPLVLVVHPSLPVATVKDLVSLAKARKGQINYASAGTGSTFHLAAELLRYEAGIDIVHVPFKGSGPAMPALLSGEVAMIFSTTPQVLPHIRAGRLRAVAVTAPTRVSFLPGIPAVAETYRGFEMFSVGGVLGPAGMPSGVVEKLNKEIATVVGRPDVRERFEALGTQSKTTAPDELGGYLKTETARFGKLIRISGTRAD